MTMISACRHFALFYLAITTSVANAAFFDQNVLVGVDIDTLPEVTVHSSGVDIHYRAFGDILIPADEAQNKAFSGVVWPGGRVVFAFDPSIPDDLQRNFWAACHLWEQGTPIKCLDHMFA